MESTMKRLLYCSVLCIATLADGTVRTAQAQALAQQRRELPKTTLADGRKAIANELKVTLREQSARALSLDAEGKSRAVNRVVLRALHPDIAEIASHHTCSRRWLNGEDIPTHLRKADGTIPRIARNFSVTLRAGADLAAVRSELKQHPDVERVEFEIITDVDSIPDDTNYGSQWAPSIIGLETAWDVPGRGRIRVAVIDTGVQLAHPEFMGRIVWDDGYADFDNGDAPTSGSRFDHGTHVAGIACATRNNNQGVAGFSNDIDLMVLNCATWDSDSSSWKIGRASAAIDDAVANGAHIINCSFSLGVELEDEVEDAYDASVLVVNAAGNDAGNIGGSWESGSVALFTVTATRSSGSPATDVFDASYSNFGPGVDIAAPGTGIWSTVPTIAPSRDCNNQPAPMGYGCKNGTSMATPQVSGAAALIMSMNPLLIGHLSARHLLIRMAEDKGPAGYDQQYGWGALRLRQSTLQACRDATAFVSSANAGVEGGNYDQPWRTLPAALANVPNGATLILNGGLTDVPVYTYPSITITKPCTLSAIPDRPVTIGN
jgi:subtilisin family serine protease